MVSRRLYELAGFAVGFVLIDYGFNFIVVGFPGARSTTSQFLGANFLAAGSVLVFIGVYYLLSPTGLKSPAGVPVTAAPDVGMEQVVEEAAGPQVGFYRNIEYIRYVFTVLGLFSAADLVMQVLVSSHYDEARWWVEVLLVVFGVLSYTIFPSIRRIRSQKEAKLAARNAVASKIASTTPSQLQETPPTPALTSTPSSSHSSILELNLDQFTKTPSGEYELHLAGNTYDMFRVESEMVTVWREERQAIRSLYLAGPYELKRSTLEEQIARNQDLKIGSLAVNVATVRKLIELQTQTRN